ncbi:MAG: hypothetical protein KUG82_06345 [Pseudomonadales bacterium]|nr:hypothetical protein [Pseudomonadales bacterium]
MRSIDDYNIFVQLVKKFSVKKVTTHAQSEDVAAILAAHPKLVIAMHHGPVTGGGHLISALYDILHKNGGDNRTPMWIVWKHFYTFPVVRHMIRWFTQISSHLKIDALLQLFNNEDSRDLLVLPEGELCFFGNGSDIQPFMSPKFIELAIRSHVPVLVVTHHGLHPVIKVIDLSGWKAKLLKPILPSQTARNLIEKNGIMNIPVGLPGRLDELQFSFKLYHPSITEEQLAEDVGERQLQLLKESEAVRNIMIDAVAFMSSSADSKVQADNGLSDDSGDREDGGNDKTKAA